MINSVGRHSFHHPVHHHETASVKKKARVRHATQAENSELKKITESIENLKEAREHVESIRKEFPNPEQVDDFMGGLSEALEHLHRALPDDAFARRIGSVFAYNICKTLINDFKELDKTLPSFVPDEVEERIAALKYLLEQTVRRLTP